jgi:hypothetical protein
VTVEQAPPYVRITVRNGPPATGQPPADGTRQPAQPGQSGQPGDPGHGLPGMRERVALLGGQLRAGPEPGGGFAVRAVLPMDDTGATVAAPGRLAAQRDEAP